MGRCRERRRRSASSDLHLLPPRPGPRRPGRAHIARGLRPYNRRNRARIPYQVPTSAELPARLDSVLRVIYLVFNEGYTASSGPDVLRLDLSSEAIRLGRLLVDLLPEPEAMGLLALMLLHESRRRARISESGDLILLEVQDRKAGIEPSPVVELNRAVAIAMRDGPAAGLALIDVILERGDLVDYRPAHAARAELCRRVGKNTEARASYQRALALARQEPERRFLERRLAEIST